MLTKRLSLHQGENVEDFYFWSTGIDSKSDSGSKLKEKIESICTLINGLADLAHYHDSKSETDTF